MVVLAVPRHPSATCASVYAALNKRADRREAGEPPLLWFVGKQLRHEALLADYGLQTGSQLWQGGRLSGGGCVNGKQSTAAVMPDDKASDTPTPELLRDNAPDPAKQAEGIRALVPGKPHRLVEINSQDWLAHYGVFGSESEVLGLIRRTDPGLLLAGVQYSLYIHTTPLQHLSNPAFLPLGDVVEWGSDPAAYKTRKDTLPGCKLRVVDKARHTVECVEMRGATLGEVEKFHAKYKGETSRLKQGRLLMPYILVGSDGEEKFVNLVSSDKAKPKAFAKVALEPERLYDVIIYPTCQGKTETVHGKDLDLNPDQCTDGLSWVQWAAADGAGPPDLVISYSWDLNWDYLIAYVKRHLGPDVRVWIDILACAQHPIARGEMDEIFRLPEVIAFSGKTLVMPGTIKRIWCLYEFAWSINLNGGGCLFYAGFDDEAAVGLGEVATAKLMALVEEDKAGLQADDPTAMLEGAECFNPKDEEYIRSTIRDRLGGKRQVSMIIRHQFRSLAGVEGGGGLVASSGRDALVGLFLECNGPNWKQRRNWMEQVPLKEWDGVEAGSDDGAVTDLQLESNGVSGRVLDVVFVQNRALFTSLVGINIQDNGATGTFNVLVASAVHAVPFNTHACRRSHPVAGAP